MVRWYSIRKTRALCCILLGWMGCVVGQSTVAAKPKTQGLISVRYQRPMVTYLGLEGRGLTRVSGMKLDTIEQVVRKKVETARFIYLKLPLGSARESDFVRRMVAVVSQRSMGIARMRTAWNSEFQGYAVTSKTLDMIQNQSFFYWLEIDAISKKSRLGNRLYTYTIRGRMHIRRLLIFDCSKANQRLSGRHREACQGKNNQDYAGFARPYKVLSASATNIPNFSNNTALLEAGRLFGNELTKELAKLRDFQLHAPVMRGGINTISLGLGKKEGLRLNQAFHVYVRHISGKLRYRGFVKVRSVGDNRLRFEGNRKVRVNPNAPLLSSAQIITSARGLRLRKGMLAYEAPSSGLFVGGGFVMSPLSFSGFAANSPSLGLVGFSESGVLLPSIRLFGGYDVSNSWGMNEFFWLAFLELGIADVDYSGGGISDEVLGHITAGIGLQKKFYIRRFVFGAEASLLGSYVMAGSLGGLSLGGEASLHVGAFVSQSWGVKLHVGFRALIPITHKFWTLGPFINLAVTRSF